MPAYRLGIVGSGSYPINHMGLVDSLILRMHDWARDNGKELFIVSGVDPVSTGRVNQRKDRPEEAAVRLARGLGISTRTPGRSWVGWKNLGKCGQDRNAWLVERSDALVAFWDGTSTGTADAIERAWQKRIRVTVYDLRGNKATDQWIEERLNHVIIHYGRQPFA